MAADQNRTVIERFLDAFSRGDVEIAMSLLSEDATWWVAGSIEGISGTASRVEIRVLLENVATITVDGKPPQLEATGWTSEGPRAAVEVSSRAEMTNGKRYDNEYHFLFLLADGKITAIREYCDTDLTRRVFVV